MKIGDDIRLIGVRILAILYICVLFVVFGIMITNWLDEFGYHDIFVNSDNDEKDSIPLLVFELGLMIGILGVIAFLGRSLIQLIPFPLNGVCGFDYENVRELTSGAIFFVIMFNFSASIQHKISFLQTRLNLYKTKKYNRVIRVVDK